MIDNIGQTVCSMRSLRTAALAGVCVAALQAGGAHAQAPAATTTTTTTTTTPAAAPAPAPVWHTPTMSEFLKSIKYTAQVEGGISFNPHPPQDSINFGQLFTDHANTVQLNQVLLTAERDTDPAATDWDFGFKLQAAYGSDVRYTHYLGEFTHVTDDRYQPEILEANVSVHMPIAFSSGIDLKVGQFSTPEGYEVINASGNPFYSHSYIFFYGLPFVATGALAIMHVNPTLDLYAEADTGLNTTFGDGDENSEPAGLAGFGLNALMGGKLTVLALSHFGPENSTKLLGNAANHYFRFLNDVTITYKPNAKLTLVTDVNYSREDYFKAQAYGVAQYASTPITDTITLNGRAEFFRDEENFFVANFRRNDDFVNLQLGNNVPGAIFAPASQNTYSEFTLGLSIAPKVPAPIASLTFRPEIRYDRSLGYSRPYNGGADKGAFTMAADMILGF